MKEHSVIDMLPALHISRTGQEIHLEFSGSPMRGEAELVCRISTSIGEAALLALSLMHTGDMINNQGNGEIRWEPDPGSQGDEQWMAIIRDIGESEISVIEDEAMIWGRMIWLTCKLPESFADQLTRPMLDSYKLSIGLSAPHRQGQQAMMELRSAGERIWQGPAGQFELLVDALEQGEHEELMLSNTEGSLMVRGRHIGCELISPELHLWISDAEVTELQNQITGSLIGLGHTHRRKKPGVTSAAGARPSGPVPLDQLLPG